MSGPWLRSAGALFLTSVRAGQTRRLRVVSKPEGTPSGHGWKRTKKTGLTTRPIERKEPFAAAQTGVGGRGRNDGETGRPPWEADPIAAPEDSGGRSPRIRLNLRPVRLANVGSAGVVMGLVAERMA